MPNYFVDAANGNNGNSGLTMDLAWATLEYALESGALAAGDYAWWRRGATEIPVTDVLPIYNGTPALPIRIIGCPRNSHAITSSDWTNGSTSVTVDDNDMVRERHQGRYITAPDGNTYLITRVSATGTIIIDREYVGTTVTNQAATILADEDYGGAVWAAIDDSAWTIKKSAWEADADNLPQLDFNDADLQLYINTHPYYVFKNIEFKDSTDMTGVVWASASIVSFVGCLFKQSAQNDVIYNGRGSLSVLLRSIIEGSGAGAAQHGVSLSATGVQKLIMKDSAIYNCGARGISACDNIELDNVNIGVEQANGSSDIYGEKELVVKGRDVKLGGTNGTVTYQTAVGALLPFGKVFIENYGKVLGDNRTFFPGGYFDKALVAAGTPNKKLSDYVIKITPGASGFEYIPDWAMPVMKRVFHCGTDSRSFKFWIYNDSGVTLNPNSAKENIWMSVKYVSAYDDTSEYVMSEKFSTQEDIADAASDTDWDYLEVTGVQPAVASNVEVTIYFSKYLAATNVYIDPKEVSE